ncbi:hypothetical protein SCHPADRAFT_905884 [Schizopora paradoxa]|uniref:Uncharacterized protein n=1 Tax=Schizopora paradoxa TaxID=27342 RepID=A0A0H2RQ80_9AGAM|nr:hypothetical protein SCHPADRAFT_905884 [Schizopora paradoxa]
MSSKLARTLPDDLLYLIFSHALPSTFVECSMPEHDNPLEGLDVYEVSPMNFSLVCRSWRNIVMSQGRLWSSIKINFKLSEYSEPFLMAPPTSRILRTWFRNSRNNPLNIQVTGRVPRDQISTFRHILNVFLEEQHRWNRIAFNMSHLGLPYTLENITIATQSLTSVHLNFTEHPPQRPITIDFSSCRQRSGVELEIRGPQPLLLENLESLCLYTFADRDLPGLQRLLLASPNLRSLEIGIQDFSVVNLLATKTTLLFSSLTHLTIASATTFLTLELLAWLECPNLTHFTFTALRCIYEVKHTKEFLLEFEQFLFRSHPQLRCLALQVYRHWDVHWGFFEQDDEDESDQALSQECAQITRRILSALGSLNTLSLAGITVDEQLAEAMVLRKGDAGSVSCGVCPQLESICLSCEYSHVSPETLVDIITSRWELGSSFKEVDLCLPGDYERIEETRKDVARCIGRRS